MSEVRVWIADLKDIQPEGTGMSMIATNQPVVSKIDHDAAQQTLRDERDRYKDVLEMIADGPGTNGYCTQYERYMIELAQAALTPAGGERK